MEARDPYPNVKLPLIEARRREERGRPTLTMEIGVWTSALLPLLPLGREMREVGINARDDSVSKLAEKAGERRIMNGKERGERWVPGLHIASKQGMFIIQVRLCLEFHVLPVPLIPLIVLLNLESPLKEDFD